MDELLKYALGTIYQLVDHSLLKTILLSFDLQQPIPHGAHMVDHLAGMGRVTQMQEHPITFSFIITPHFSRSNIQQVPGKMDLQYQVGILLPSQIG